MYKESKLKRFGCVEVQRRIPEFMEYKLSGYEAEAIVEHCKICKECMEELRLIFLVQACLDETDHDDMAEIAEEELMQRFEAIERRLNFIAMLNRNAAYFVIASSIFLLLSLLVDFFV